MPVRGADEQAHHDGPIVEAEAHLKDLLASGAGGNALAIAESRVVKARSKAAREGLAPPRASASRAK